MHPPLLVVIIHSFKNKQTLSFFVSSIKIIVVSKLTWFCSSVYILTICNVRLSFSMWEKKWGN